MKYFLSIAITFVIAIHAFCQNHSTINSDSVLVSLKKGNNDFVNGIFNLRGVDPSLRAELAKAQYPKAIVLTCSDSRVSPELVFNQGLGDLFVIRIAGNIADDDIIASIEYAVEHLHTPLVVVMGHTSCGAVGATVADMQDPSNKIDNHLRALTDKIERAMEFENLNEPDMNKKALLSNVIFTVHTLSQSRPVLGEAIKKEELKIVGAVYDLSTGKVIWL